eukprot:TRINITY_DN3706_c0_g1_i1.p1 TRINITY_DN3706_c0_g1~~TRINITY_DN3706_c0_g1_i1.p1  ORF type:complete len:362 (+),score=105.31 TRINITY_DN3706_c0_g1_i1:64-1149(+)
MGNTIKKAPSITQHYELKDKLGTGSFAVVRRAIRIRDQREFAIKIISKKKLNAEELAVVNDEVEIMHRIDHPNVVKLYEIYDTTSKLYMVMELLTGGELFERIVDKQSFSEREAANVIRQIASAMSYLHSIGVVHRDLKPENLLYESKEDTAQVKITDFGLAKYLETSGVSMTTACGTPGYVAPEILKDEPYGPEVDCWSLGVILYVLLCGFPPFYNENQAQLYQDIKSGEFSFPDPYWTDISAEAKDLITRLLTVDPFYRLDMKGVLAHPWLAEGGASDKQFSADHLQKLRSIQLRARLKKGMNMVRAVTRMSRMLGHHREGSLNLSSLGHHSDDEDFDNDGTPRRHHADEEAAKLRDDR